MAFDPGRRLGPYEIVGRIGAGGMGVVYRARDGRLGRDVAVKVLHDQLARSPERLRRFEHEARAAGALNHPNIVVVHDVGHDAGAPFIVTELLDGETLRERLRRGAIGLREVQEIAAQIAGGLAAAHERGIVHRDLKPENLFMTRDGRVKILDFGVAKLGPALEGAAGDAATVSRDTRPGDIIGTLGYLSPEQARGEDADSRADVFALGAVLHEMLSGAPPFAGSSAAETLSAILRDDPPALGGETPAWLERIVRRCLRKNPGERFTSARDVGFALEASSRGNDAEPPPGRTTRSIAVLPFRNLAGARDDVHIGIGLADATITELSMVGALTVRPTSAILRYQEHAPDPRHVARELDVDAVVDGSFQRVEQKLRITVQLVSADGRSLWAFKVDASLRDLFEMQDEVSRRIAEALHVQVTSGDSHRLTRAPRRARSEEAYEQYFRGRLGLFRGRLPGVLAAIESLERSTAADPEFPPAWATLGDAYARMAFEHEPERDWYDRAQAMCARALALDPSLPEGRYLRGRLAWSPRAGFDHETAMREAGHALAENPALVGARYLLGVVLFHVGLPIDGEAEFIKALAVDPGDTYARMHVTTCLLHQGRFDEAVSRAKSDVEALPDAWAWSNLVIGLLRLNRLDEAGRAIEQMRSANPDYPEADSLSGVLASLCGDRPGTRRALDRIVQAPHDLGHFHHAQYDAACALAGLGELDEAAAWLRAAAGNGYPCSTFFAADPLLDPLRDHPDYGALMKDLSVERQRYLTVLDELRGSYR